MRNLSRLLSIHPFTLRLALFAAFNTLIINALLITVLGNNNFNHHCGLYLSDTLSDILICGAACYQAQMGK